MAQFKHIIIRKHTNPDIFEIIFKDKSRDAVDEYAEAILEYGMSLRDENKLNRPIYIIVDISQSGLYSLQYALTRIRTNIVQLSDLPRAYFAYITDDHGDRILINQFAFMQNSRSKDSRQVFGSDQRDEAIAWLLTKTRV